MSSVPVRSGQRLILNGISWRTYERLLRAFDERHVRITYDRGALEIMTLSPEHERFKHLLPGIISLMVAYGFICGLTYFSVELPKHVYKSSLAFLDHESATESGRRPSVRRHHRFRLHRRDAARKQGERRVASFDK